MPTAQDVVAEARTWLDTPYGHQHREKGQLVDCVGLLIGVCRTLGLVAPDFDVNGYAQVPDGKSFLATCDQHMDRISLRELAPGHVLTLRFNEDPQHIGIVERYWHGTDLALIHAYSAARPFGRVVEHRLIFSAKLIKPVQGYALRGVEY